MSSSYEYVLDADALDGLSATIVFDMDPDGSPVGDVDTAHGRHHHGSPTGPSGSYYTHYYTRGYTAWSDAGSSRRSSRRSAPRRGCGGADSQRGHGTSVRSSHSGSRRRRRRARRGAPFCSTYIADSGVVSSDDGDPVSHDGVVVASNKRLRKKLKRQRGGGGLRVSAAVESLASRAATPATGTEDGPAHAMSRYFISPIHQSVAEASTPWPEHDTRYAFLGQGGLSGVAEHPHRTSLASLVRGEENGRRTATHTSGGRRRRGENYVCVCVGYCSSTESEGSDGDDGATLPREGRRSRKRRRLARRAMTAECGGSMVLRPLPCPTITPPGTTLPSSIASAHDDPLACSLDKVTLDEDDFKLY